MAARFATAGSRPPEAGQMIRPGFDGRHGTTGESPPRHLVKSGCVMPCAISCPVRQSAGGWRPVFAPAAMDNVDTGQHGRAAENLYGSKGLTQDRHGQQPGQHRLH